MSQGWEDGREGRGREWERAPGKDAEKYRQTRRMYVRTPPQSPGATVYRDCGAFLALLQSSWPPVSVWRPALRSTGSLSPECEKKQSPAKRTFRTIAEGEGSAHSSLARIIQLVH